LRSSRVNRCRVASRTGSDNYYVANFTHRNHYFQLALPRTGRAGQVYRPGLRADLVELAELVE
jgi:hypothetical protein